MELGGRSSSRHCREESCFRSEIEGLHPPRYQRRTPVFHQERQNRSRRNSQRLSASAFEIVAQKEWEEITAKNETLSGVLPWPVLPRIRLRNSLFGCHCEWRRDDHLAQHYQHRLAGLTGDSNDVDGSERERHARYLDLSRELLDKERQTILQLRDSGRIDDGVLHKIEHELDLSETRLNAAIQHRTGD